MKRNVSSDESGRVRYHMQMIRHAHVGIQRKLSCFRPPIKRLANNFLYGILTKYREPIFGDRCQKVTRRVSGDDMHGWQDKSRRAQLEQQESGKLIHHDARNLRPSLKGPRSVGL